MSSIDEMKLKAADFMTKGGAEGAIAGGTGANGIGAGLGMAGIAGFTALKNSMTPKKTPPTLNISNKNPIIPDRTDENLGTQNIQPMNFWEEMKKIRDEEWAREDEKQAHVEAREDTAYSRAIEDLRRSGVNINLLGNINPAASGGGLTNQTGSMDYSMTQSEYNANIEKILQEIELNWKGNQAEKDRFIELIGKMMMAGAILTK